ncbi:hypothetical protein [Sulfobacillus thermosulfidooxidans]|uniref:hypothetical protein n=1 Tax=Sulfobacillus thermosulfidooxidans TaxID=28034 RepID=UPI0006B4D3F8|nr:hypothetical protein [Sulfobacillus thermosulfidooxidans]
MSLSKISLWTALIPDTVLVDLWQTLTHNLFDRDTLSQIRSDSLWPLFVPDALLPALAQHGHLAIREAIAASPHLNKTLANILSQDADHHVLAALSINPRTPRSALAQLVENPHITDNSTLHAIAAHPHANDTLRNTIYARLRPQT